MTAAVISLETTVLSALPLGFNNLMHGYFRTLVVGYGRCRGQHDPAYLAVLYRLQRGRSGLGPVCRCGRAGDRRFVALPQQFYGFGFFVGAAVFFIVALLRLDTYTANLPYRILSQQPIVAADKTGGFYRLAGCSTVPSSAMRTSAQGGAARCV